MSSIEPDSVAPGAKRYAIHGVVIETGFPFSTALLSTSASPDLVFTSDDVNASYLQEEDGELLYASANDAADGGAALSFYVSGDVYRIRFGRHLAFDVTEQAIRARVARSSTAASVEIGFLGLVLAYWLELRGRLCIHASAVAHDEKAIAFVATNKGGKSSMAADMATAGGRFLTDDLLVLLPVENAIMAQAAFPELRMWPSQAEHFASGEDLCPVAAHVEKLRLPLLRLGAHFQPRAAPLDRIYFLNRGEKRSGVRIEPVDAPTSFRTLLSQSTAVRLLTATGAHSQRHAQLSRLAREVPGFMLSYPDDHAMMQEVCSVVLRGES